jgi:cell division protein YceG involved in septum cleavage
MKRYTKLNNIKNLQAGKYAFNNSENLESIIYHLKNGEVLDEEIKITFIEGKNMRYIAKVIANNTVNTEEDVFNLLNDEE